MLGPRKSTEATVSLAAMRSPSETSLSLLTGCSSRPATITCSSSSVVSDLHRTSIFWSLHMRLTVTIVSLMTGCNRFSARRICFRIVSAGTSSSLDNCEIAALFIIPIEHSSRKLLARASSFSHAMLRTENGAIGTRIATSGVAILLSCGMPLLATARSAVAFWTVAAFCSSHAFCSAQNAAALLSALSLASAPCSSVTGFSAIAAAFFSAAALRLSSVAGLTAIVIFSFRLVMRLSSRMLSSLSHVARLSLYPFHLTRY